MSGCEVRHHRDVTVLVRSEGHGERDVETLRGRVTELERLLGERAAQVARLQSKLDASGRDIIMVATNRLEAMRPPQACTNLR